MRYRAIKERAYWPVLVEPAVEPRASAKKITDYSLAVSVQPNSDICRSINTAAEATVFTGHFNVHRKPINSHMTNAVNLIYFCNAPDHGMKLLCLYN